MEILYGVLCDLCTGLFLELELLEVGMYQGGRKERIEANGLLWSCRSRSTKVGKIDKNVSFCAGRSAFARVLFFIFKFFPFFSILRAA